MWVLYIYIYESFINLKLKVNTILNGVCFSFLAVAETTSELRVAGTRKVPGNPSSSNQLPTGSPGPITARRSQLFTANRIQPTTDHIYETHLPLIRDSTGIVERQQQFYDELNYRSRPKTPVTNASPKNTARPPSASISSIFNTLSKRSTENFMNSYGELDELIISPSRESRRPSNESSKYGIGTNQTPTKQIITPQKNSGDSGVDSRHSASSPDTNQQQRVFGLSNRIRSTVPNVHGETSPVYETTTKERTNTGKSTTLYIRWSIIFF